MNRPFVADLLFVAERGSVINCGCGPKAKSQTTVEAFWDFFCWYPEPGSNRHGHCWPQDFKSGVSTDSTIRAQPSAGKTSAKVRNNLRSAKSRRWNRCRFVFRSRDLHLQPRSPTRSLAGNRAGFEPALRIPAPACSPFPWPAHPEQTRIREAFSEAGSEVTYSLPEAAGTAAVLSM